MRMKDHFKVFSAIFPIIAITQVVSFKENLKSLPIISNVNFGHAKPIGIIPYGIKVELNCENKTITFLESATI